MTRMLEKFTKESNRFQIYEGDGTSMKVEVEVVTMKGPISVWSIDRDGQYNLMDAGALESCFRGIVNDLKGIYVQGVKGEEFSYVLRVRPVKSFVPADPIPAVVEVDEPVMSDDERVRRQVMAVMQQFIPDQGQVDTAMGQLDDIFEGEGALDDDTDLDVLFLNEGPAAVIAEMERREKEADGEEVVLDEPEGEANPPSPEPSSSGDGPETGS